MFSWESRRTRRSGRDRRRPDIAAEVETLEGRQLLAYNALGVSLPDLTVSGFAPPVAAWGNDMAVTVNVKNIGVATMLDPLGLAPDSTGSVDAPASVVAVYATRSPRSLSGKVLVGTVDIPALNGNSVVQITQTFTLPTQPTGFPGDGGRVYLWFQANATGTVFESDTTNNVSHPVPLTIEAPLPELAAVGLDVPARMQPGDTIQPNIRIANLGTVDSAPQGPVTVELVASTTPTFNPADSTVIAAYSIDSIPPQSLVPAQGAVFADANLTPGENVVTIAGDPVTLPTSPRTYYIGVVVDPANQIQQLKNVPQFHKSLNQLTLIRKVGPPIPGLPPAGVNVAGGVANVPVFPNAFGGIQVGASPNGTFPPLFPPGPLSSLVSSSSTVAASDTSVSSAKVNQFAAGTTAAERRAAILSKFQG